MHESEVRSQSHARSFYARSAMEVLRRPRDAGLFLASGAAYALGHAALALAIAGCVDGLGGGRGVALLAAKPLEFALFGLAAAVLKFIGNVVGTTVQARMGGEVGAALREGVLRHLLSEGSLAQPRHSDQGGATKETGWARRVSALTEDVSVCERGLSTGLLATAKAVLQMIPLVALLVVLAPRLSLVALAVLGPLAWVLGRARRALRRGLAREAAEKESLLHGADEAVRNAELFRTFGAGSTVRARVRRLGESLTRQAMKVAAGSAALSGANEIAAALAVVGVVVAVGSGVLGGAASSTLIPFTLTFFMAYKPLRDVADARVASAKAAIAWERIAPYLDDTSDAPEASPSRARKKTERLELRGLRLRHGTLGELDLAIEPGELVALVAPTGTGKTTLFRTLLGLEHPLAGDVLYGGASLRDAGVGPVERPFAWCPQESPIVADAISGNVVLNPSDAADETAREALSAIGAGSLAEDVSAKIGDGARALSGGERQWIALARALATEAPILLLDEPTSGLDREAQREVLAAIRLLRGKRTILMVTHREEPLGVVDRVVRVGEGKIGVVAAAE